MIIALDYDGTYTLDPAFWDDVIGEAGVRGHTVVLATSRDSTAGLPVITGLAQVVCCGATHKRLACEAAGVKVDAWIDDQPETVNGPGWLWWARFKGAVKALFARP